MKSALPDRLVTLVVARAASTRPSSRPEFVAALRRYAARDQADAEWKQQIAIAVATAKGTGLLDSDERATAAALRERMGTSAANATWRQLTDRVLPLLGLGVALDDTRTASRLKDRDAWTAAIAGRLLGLWTDGSPPSLPTVCDAFTWRQLGLRGKPRRCPPEIRAHFLQREFALDITQPDRLLRLYIARELDVPRPEMRALRDALVRRWMADAPLQRHENEAGLLQAVTAAARRTVRGVFGERKVFISAVWDELRRDPAWAPLPLDDLKRQLLAAHQSGDVVLARADLVAAMDPALVAASETAADGATFHFIVREPP